MCIYMYMLLLSLLSIAVSFFTISFFGILYARLTVLYTFSQYYIQCIYMIVDVCIEKLTWPGVRGGCEGSSAGSPRVSNVERSEGRVEGRGEGETAGRR